MTNPWFDDDSSPPVHSGRGSTGKHDGGTPIHDAIAAGLTDAASRGARGEQQPDIDPTVVIDPGTTEGTAIVWLYSLIKDVEVDDEYHSWLGVDVVEQLLFWFDAVGIDVRDDPPTAARKLRLSEKLASAHLHGSDFAVRIHTQHPDAGTHVRASVSTLVATLGPHSDASVFDADDDQIAYCAHSDTDPGPQ